MTIENEEGNGIHSEGVHMLDGLVDEEMDHPTIVPVFKIDVLTVVEPYISELAPEESEDPHELDPQSIEELRHTRDALDRELAISQRVKASTLEEINLGSCTEPRTLKIAKALASEEQSALIKLLTEYQDVFAWSYSDMKGLEPQYY